MKRSWSRLKLPAILLVAILFFLLFHERQLSGFDPANFVLAIKYGYSISQARPHGPGYPGFYVLWKAIETVTKLSPHATILVANLGFSLLTIVLIYVATRRFYNEQTAIIATLFTLTNPFLLYFGSITELYVYDAAFSAFLVTLLIVPSRFEIGLYVLYGLLGSFRLSSFLLSLPVLLISFMLRYKRDQSLRDLFRFSIAIIIGFLLWFVPFLYAIGGWEQFIGMMRGINDLPTALVQNLGRFVPAMVWMVNVLFLVAALNAKRIWNTFLRFESRFIVLLLLIVFPTLFFAFRYYEKGYALLLFAPIVILGSRLIERGRYRTLTLASVLGVNLLLFVAVPFVPPSVTSSLNHEHRTSSERAKSFLLRETSFFAPTLSHVRASDQASETANTLINVLPIGSKIMINMAASQWAYPRSLQAEYPEKTFLFPEESDSSLLRRFVRDSMDYRYTWNKLWNDLDNKPTFYYLTDRQLAHEIGAPPGHWISEAGHLALFSVLPDSFQALKHYNRTFFYRGRE
jgi:hypothetical protein